MKATGQIGFFKIISESAVAAGVRRIEAITGTKCAAVIREHFDLVHRLGELLHNPKDFVSTLSKVIDENSALKKEIEKSIIEKSLALKSDLEQKIQQINGVNFLATQVELPNAEALKTLAYALKGAVDNLFLVLGADFEGKPNLTVVVSDQLSKERGLNAGTIVRELAKEINGGGGGQPFFATAGGKNPEGLPAAIAKAKNYIQ